MSIKNTKANLKRWESEENRNKQSEALRKAHAEGRHPMTEGKKAHLKQLAKNRVGKTTTEKQRLAASIAGKKRAKRHLVEGKLLSVSEAAELYSKKEQLLRDRLNYGWTLEEACTLKRRPIYLGKKYRWNGGLYTLRQISELSGVDHKTILSRINTGWEVDDAAKKDKYPGRDLDNTQGLVYGIYVENSLVYVGITIRSLKKRLSNHSIHKRCPDKFQPKILYRGSLPNIIREEIRLIKTYSPIYNISKGGEIGGCYKNYIEWNNDMYTYAEIAEMFNICPQTLYGRIHTQKWSIEDAIQKPTLKMNQKYLYQNEYLTLPTIAQRCGINYTTLRYRIGKKKESLEIATSRPSRLTKKYPFGGEMLTLAEIRNRTGLTTEAIHYRINNNISLLKK